MREKLEKEKTPEDACMAPRDSFASISQMSVQCVCYDQDSFFLFFKIVLNSNCFLVFNFGECCVGLVHDWESAERSYNLHPATFNFFIFYFGIELQLTTLWSWSLERRQQGRLKLFFLNFSHLFMNTRFIT